MKVNENINFLKRRGLLIEDTDGVNDSQAVTPTGEIDFHYLCEKNSNNPENIYCRLKELEDVSKLDLGMTKDLGKNVNVIYQKLRPNLLDNRRRFHKLMNMLLDSNMPLNSIKIFSEYLKDSDKKEVIKIIDKLKDEDVPTTDEELDALIKLATTTKYQEYENSFVGEHFIKHTTGLRLQYRSDEFLDKKFYELVMDVISGSKTINSLNNSLVEVLSKNVSKEEFIKADLKCVSPLFVENTDKKLIRVNDFVEVKYMDVLGDSYLSEFFAIYKNPEQLPDEVKTEDFIKVYNHIIDLLFSYIKSSGWGESILGYISENFAGVFYEENTFIPSEYIELYWSNVGRSNPQKQRRLSIRYKLKSGTVLGYKYNPNSDYMSGVNFTSNNDKRIIYYGASDLSLNRYVDESFIKESNDFDWVKSHIESIPDKPEVEALIKLLGSNNVLGDGFDEQHSDWYGNLDVIHTSSGEEWVVGDATSMGNALYEYYDNLLDDVGYEGLGIDLDDYIDVSSYWVSSFCDDEADNQFYDMSNEDYLEYYGDYDILAEIEELNEEYEELEKEYEEVEEIINQYREALETMEIQNQDYIQYGYLEQPHTEEEFEVFQNKVDKLTNVLIVIEKKLENIPETKEEYIEKLKEYVRQDYIDECERCMEYPIYCLVNEKGWFSDSSEVIEHMGFGVDRDGILDYLTQDEDYGQISGYDGRYQTEEVNGTEYILIRVN
jgi:hypothetical protein